MLSSPVLTGENAKRLLAEQERRKQERKKKKDKIKKFSDEEYRLLRLRRRFGRGILSVHGNVNYIIKF